MRCPQCDKTWTGLKMCHCASCHRHFSTLVAFDAHQVASNDWKCQDPPTEKYEKDESGIWRGKSNGYRFVREKAA